MQGRFHEHLSGLAVHRLHLHLGLQPDLLPELRISHGQASLEELGSLAVPPMTKDAIAGRIRRLLAMADKRASELGIPDTEAGLSPDLLN